MVDFSSTLPPLETRRARLRCPELRDAEAIAGLMSEAISRCLASWPVPCTVEMAAERIAGIRIAAAAGQCLPLVVERRADGAVAGWIVATRTKDDEATALLTYWLGERFQGEGLMRDAAPVVLAEAFLRLKVARVRAAVQPENAASLAVTRLLGMVPLGPGRIWCPARGQEEACLWFEATRG